MSKRGTKNIFISVIIFSLVLFLFSIGLSWVGAETTPANYVLISEVFYDTPGTDADQEWIEIYNPTSSAVDISNYKLGDEETQAGTEGMFEFPATTELKVGAKMSIALKATGFYALYNKNPDFEIAETDANVPNLTKYAAWGTGNVFSLANTGDEILLLDKTDAAIDVVAYEGGSYTGVTPHPGAAVGHSVERYPANQDTNDCSVDFRDQESPNPETSLVGDVTRPVISDSKPEDGAIVGIIKPVIGAVYSDAESGVDISTVRIYLDEVDKTSEATVSETAVSYLSAEGLSEGSHTVKVEVKDKVGNFEVVIWNFKILPGDADGNGKVDIFDLVIVAKAFGSIKESGSWDIRADINVDGKVDIFDLVIVGKNFGKSV